MQLVKNFLLFIGQVLLLAFLGFLARECWQMYKTAKKIERVRQDGVRVLVRLDEVSHAKKTWRDYVTNGGYVTFHYQGKIYAMHYTQDSVFLQEGAQVPVIYSSSNDEVVQPGKDFRQKELYKTSPLVHWSVIRLFSGPNSALFFFVILAGLFLLLATHFVANLTGIGLIRKLGNLLVIGCAVGGAIYLTYDAVSYWRYYSHLRNNGAPGTVRVEEIEREKAFKNDRSKVFVFYVYKARVSFQNESRVIAVGSADYEHTRTGQPLNVLYDKTKDDMMAVNYSPEYNILIFPLIVWLLLLFFCIRSLRSRVKNNRAVHK